MCVCVCVCVCMIPGLGATSMISATSCREYGSLNLAEFQFGRFAILS